MDASGPRKLVRRYRTSAGEWSSAGGWANVYQVHVTVQASLITGTDYTAGVATFGLRTGVLGRRLFSSRCLIGATIAVTIATIASVGRISTMLPKLKLLSMPCPPIPPAIVPVLPLTEPITSQNPTITIAAARTASVRPI